jgi:phage-related protein
LLGVVLFVVGYALWKIQGKIKEVTLAVDSGFKSIEDGVTQNLLGPNGALTKATNAVDQNYQTINNGINNNIFGSTGLLSKSRYIMNYANTICIGVGNDIHDGKLILQDDIRKTTGDIETILQDTGNPLKDAGKGLNDIGDVIDIDIAGAHPFQGLAKPFHDAGNTCINIGGLCLSARLKLQTADQKIIQAENSLEDVSIKVKALGPEIIQVRDYIDTSLTNGINTSLNDLKQVTDSVKTLFSTLENGAQTSVNNLKNANTYLDSLLTNIFQKQLIIGLFSAGIILILTGVAIGL